MVQVFAGERTLIIEYDSKQDTVALAGPLFYVSSEQSHTCIIYARFGIGDQADADVVLSIFEIKYFYRPLLFPHKTSSIYIRVSRYSSRNAEQSSDITAARTNLHFHCYFAQKK